MEYTINKLARLAGVSTRTLRYYDEIGLLEPSHIKENGYRIYGQTQIDQLQQIMLYRELSMPLEDIKKIICDDNFNPDIALEEHLRSLLTKKLQLDILIANVQKTIASNKGEIMMENNEKFEGFKTQLIEDNEKQYGTEIREKYGDDAINKSNAKIKGMSQEQYAKLDKLTEDLNEALKLAVATNNPASEQAQIACELHKEWLCYFWEDGMYSKEAHLSLAEMYVADERFAAHYENIAPGCAVFLKESLEVYCK